MGRLREVRLRFWKRVIWEEVGSEARVSRRFVKVFMGVGGGFVFV